jgi:N6-adenosine-specific RNA methylase IME4
VVELAKSIALVGLLHPIVVTPTARSKYALVAGLHRVEACRSLGWKTVPATVLRTSSLQAQLATIDENIVRNELTALQRADALLDRKRIYEAIHGTLKGRPRKRETISSFSSDAARKTGLTPRSVRHEIQIATALPAEVKTLVSQTWVADHKQGLLKLARLPQREQFAVARALASGRAKSVRDALLKRATARVNRSAAMPGGRYDCIVVDPPWPYDHQSPDYPTMSLDAIRTLPISTLAAEDAVLFLWTTNAMMRHVYPLLDAWGFVEKTIVTWQKTRSVKGNYLLNATEHAVLAVRGKPLIMLTTQTTLLRAPNREHSRKPDEFYDLVSSLCPGRRLDMFARESRKGWTTWGAEKKHFDRSNAG